MKTFKVPIINAIGVLVLALTLPAQAYLDHWNSGTGGKPSRDGLVWEHGPTNATLLWQAGLPCGYGFPPVMEGNVVVMSCAATFAANPTNAQSEALIVAQNVTNGDVLWTNTLPVDFPATDWYSAVVGMRDGRVYADRTGNDSSGYLYALDAQTGAVLWRSQDLVSIYGSESPSFAPNGDLIVGNYYSLARVNATNGTTIWSAPRVSPGTGGSEPAIYGNRVYCWEATGLGLQVAVFDLPTGAYLYSSPGLGSAVQLGLFVGPDGTVYAPRSQGFTNTDALIAYHDTGFALKEKWQVPLPYVPFASFGVGPDGSVYSYSQDYRVIRINPQDGSIIDSSPVMPSDFYEPRMAIDGTGLVFVNNGGFVEGALYSFNADLTQRWVIAVPDINLGGPAIGEDGILVVAGNSSGPRAYVGNSYGLPGPPIQAASDGTNMIINYSGTLQSADQATGTWTDVPGAATPWPVPLTRPQEFYRSRE
jgi:outer membrane protein assembly factor BamB